MNKLNINEKTEKKKFKLFKSNKFKALLGAGLLATTLSSCNVDAYSNYNNKEEVETKPAYTEELDHEYYFKFWLNFSNYTDEIENNELITVFNNEGTITNTMNLRYGNIKSALNVKTTKLYFNYLDKYLEIPEVNDDEILVIDVDYATKEITTSIKNINVKTK